MPLLLLLSAAPMADAAQPAPQVDAELLEFLGTIDGDGEQWQEFLEQMPVKRNAPPPAAATRPPAAATPPPAAASAPPPVGKPDKAAQDAAKVKAK